MYEEVLTEHSDLLEALDTDILFEYLVQNGALNMNTVNDMKNANEGSEQTSISLIRHLASEGDTNHMCLFINALRQTGQLQLANLLETGPRIQPRRWNSLGYLDRTRHKGQICFILQVNAIEILPEQYPKRRGLSGISYWIWMEDLHPTTVSLLENGNGTDLLAAAASSNDGSGAPSTPALNLQTSTSQPRLNARLDNVQVDEKRPRFWCCGCFASANKNKNNTKNNKAKKKTKRQTGDRRFDYACSDGGAAGGGDTELKHIVEETSSEQKPAQQQSRVLEGTATKAFTTIPVVDEPLPTTRASSGVAALCPAEPADAAVDSGLENSENEADYWSSPLSPSDEVKLKAELLQEASAKFYRLLVDQEDSRLRNRLLQYLEQYRGILVLDTIDEEDGIIIVCICTKRQQLLALQSDFLDGQLVEDLEEYLLEENVKRLLMVRNMKLQLSVDEGEFPKAIGDLEGC